MSNVFFKHIFDVYDFFWAGRFADSGRVLCLLSGMVLVLGVFRVFMVFR